MPALGVAVKLALWLLGYFAWVAACAWAERDARKVSAESNLTWLRGCHRLRSGRHGISLAVALVLAWLACLRGHDWSGALPIFTSPRSAG